MHRTARILPALAVGLLAAAGITACNPTPPPTCEGQTATIVGTSASETITGTAGNDVIMAKGGDDTVNGLGGHDRICGDAGHDTLSGGAGDDLLSGGSERDTVTYAGVAGPVNATLGATATGDGTDTLRTVEDLIGTGAADTLIGDGAGNTLTGGGGDDTLAAGGADDTCAAGGGVDTGSGCERVTGTVDPASSTDTYTLGVTAGARLFLDSALTCPAIDVSWSMAGPSGAAFSPTRVCNDRELVPSASGTATITVGGQTGTATGSYDFRVHTPVDATGSITPGGAAVTAANTTPGQSVRLSFSGSAGQRVSARMTGATFPDGYFLRVLRPNGSELVYGSHGFGTGFTDTFALDATGTWTAVIDPNGDDIGSASVRLHTVTDQTGTITVGGPTVGVDTATPGQNARFTFSGTSGQRVTARMTGGTHEDGSVLYLYRPNGTYLTYGSGYTSATINGATLDATGTWALVLDPGADGTGTATLELDPA